MPFVPDARTLQRTEILALTTDAGDLDVLARPVGFGSYDRLRDGADVFEIGDSAVRVAAIPDLLAMKRAAGREKDRDDVATLEAILRLRGPGA